MNHLLVRANSLRIPLADQSVHCCVTSPPYWGLRSYAACGCSAQGRLEIAQDDRGDRHTAGGAIAFHRIGKPDPNCELCGGTGTNKFLDAHQLGLDDTADEFVETMVSVFREVYRVLRDDGCCFINLGDSFGASKQLQGIPWKVALALQADKWILRSDIIWSKPNPMPESVTDRPTKSHEYVFLLAKRERYFFDAEAVRESGTHEQGQWRRSFVSGRAESMNRKPSGNEIDGWYQESGNRNIRSVWSIPTESYPGAHFATYPRKLVEPCIKAGTSERGCCPECGAPWERIVESERVATRPGERTKVDGFRNSAKYKDHQSFENNGALVVGNRDPGRHVTSKSTTGWQPTCNHDAAPIPATVIDIFCGSGTTGVVALAHGRRFVGLDLSAEYLKLATQRITRPHRPVPRNNHDDLPLFAKGAER